LAAVAAAVHFKEHKKKGETRSGTCAITIGQVVGFLHFDVVNIYHPQLDIVSRHETTFNNIFKNEYFLSIFEMKIAFENENTITVDRKLIGAKGNENVVVLSFGLFYFVRNKNKREAEGPTIFRLSLV
jgi:hypothetical protein